MTTEQLVRKEYIAETKALPDGTVEAVISTEDEDRDGDVILAGGWDLSDYKANPVVLLGHDASGMSVGKARDIAIKDGKLVARVEWAPTEQGQTLRKLYEGKFMNAFSVGFLPQEAEPRGDGKGWEYRSQSLLEFSAVAVPANARALQRALAKGLNVPTELIDDECTDCADKAAQADHEARKDVDNSRWNGPAAMSKCAKSSSPGSCFKSICAGKRAGDADKEESWALPHHKTAGGPANAAGVRNALARLPQTQGLTNAAAAKRHLQAHLASMHAASEISTKEYEDILAAMEILDHPEATEAEKAVAAKALEKAAGPDGDADDAYLARIHHMAREGLAVGDGDADDEVLSHIREVSAPYAHVETHGSDMHTMSQSDGAGGADLEARHLKAGAIGDGKDAESREDASEAVAALTAQVAELKSLVASQRETIEEQAGIITGRRKEHAAVPAEAHAPEVQAEVRTGEASTEVDPEILRGVVALLKAELGLD